jgi:transposase
LSSEEDLTIYRNKDVAQKIFDQLKNGMDYQRMRTHYTKTTDGKLFVTFLELVMRSVFMKALRAYEETKGLSLDIAIHELEKIQ